MPLFDKNRHPNSSKNVTADDKFAIGENAWKLFKKGYFSEALDLFKEINALYGMARCYAELQAYQLAERYYWQLLFKRPVESIPAEKYNTLLKALSSIDVQREKIKSHLFALAMFYYIRLHDNQLSLLVFSRILNESGQIKQTRKIANVLGAEDDNKLIIYLQKAPNQADEFWNGLARGYQKMRYNRHALITFAKILKSQQYSFQQVVSILLEGGDELVIFLQNTFGQFQANRLVDLARFYDSPNNYDDAVRVYAALISKEKNDVKQKFNDIQTGGDVLIASFRVYQHHDDALVGLMHLLQRNNRHQDVPWILARLVSKDDDEKFMQAGHAFQADVEELIEYLKNYTIDNSVLLSMARYYQIVACYQHARVVYACIFSKNSKKYFPTNIKTLELLATLEIPQENLSEFVSVLHGWRGSTIELLGLARLLHRTHCYDAALIVLARTSGRKDSEFEEVLTALIAGSELLIIFLEKYPMNRKVLLALARNYQSMGHFEDALIVYARLLDVSDDFLYRRIVNTLLKSGKALTDFLTCYSGSTLVFVDVARHLQEMERYNDALEIYARLLSSSCMVFKENLHKLRKGYTKLTDFLQNSTGSDNHFLGLARHLQMVRRYNDGLQVFTWLFTKNKDFILKNSVILQPKKDGVTLIDFLSTLQQPNRTHLLSLAYHYKTMGCCNHGLIVFSCLFSQSIDNPGNVLEILQCGGDALTDLLGKSNASMVELLGLIYLYQVMRRDRDIELVLARLFSGHDSDLNATKEMLHSRKQLIQLLSRSHAMSDECIVALASYYGSTGHPKAAATCYGYLLGLDLQQSITKKILNNEIHKNYNRVSFTVAYNLTLFLSHHWCSQEPFKIMQQHLRWQQDPKVIYQTLLLNYYYSDKQKLSSTTELVQFSSRHPYFSIGQLQEELHHVAYLKSDMLLSLTDKLTVKHYLPRTSRLTKLIEYLSEIFSGYQYYPFGGFVAGLLNNGFAGVCDIDIVVIADDQQDLIEKLQCIPSPHRNNLMRLPQQHVNKIGEIIGKPGITVDVVLFENINQVKPDFIHCGVLLAPNLGIIELVDNAYWYAYHKQLDTVNSVDRTFKDDPKRILRMAHYIVKHGYQLYGKLLNSKLNQRFSLFSQYLLQIRPESYAAMLNRYSDNQGLFWEMLQDWGVSFKGEGEVKCLAQNKIQSENLQQQRRKQCAGKQKKRSQRESKVASSSHDSRVDNPAVTSSWGIFWYSPVERLQSTMRTMQISSKTAYAATLFGATAAVWLMTENDDIEHGSTAINHSVSP